MYTEYTLGAADLAHISADVMRYRNTIIRSLEAENQKTFERITESFRPNGRAFNMLLIGMPPPVCACPEAAGAKRRIFRRSVTAWISISLWRAKPPICSPQNGSPGRRRKPWNCGEKLRFMPPTMGDRK